MIPLHSSNFRLLTSLFEFRSSSFSLHTFSRPAGDWTIVSMAIESEIMLTNQERNKDWEYRVIAVNKAGEGVPSNTVAAVV